MRKTSDKLKLGTGAAFPKSRLLRLPQKDVTWEADFRAMPKPMMQNATHYLGLVVVQESGAVLGTASAEGTPTGSDLATMLGHALTQSLKGDAHRPRRLLVRKNPRWQELFPVLAELGIEIVVQSDLPQVKAAFQKHLRDVQDARRANMIKPTAAQAAVEKLFPAIAQWVRDGHIEIGDQEGFGFVVRALDYGGLVFEDEKPQTLAEALAALEIGLRKWFEEQGIDLQ